MTQYNTLNVELSFSQLNKWKSGIKNSTEVTLKLPWNVVGDSNDDTNFPQKLSLTNTQVSRLRKGLKMVHQPIQKYQKLNCIKYNNQSDF